MDEEKKYKSKTIDETLEPKWNETFSLPMLTGQETLHIVSKTHWNLKLEIQNPNAECKAKNPNLKLGIRNRRLRVRNPKLGIRNPKLGIQDPKLGIRI